MNGVDLTSRGRRKSKRRSNDMYRLSYRLIILLLHFSLYTWYEVRRCVFGCWVGFFSVVAVRSPTSVHYSPTLMQRDYYDKGALFGLLYRLQLFLWLMLRYGLERPVGIRI